MPGASATQIPELLAPLLSDPGAAAVLTDIDGTLAPIVEHAEDAAVPTATRAALTELSRRYALVACISGRRAERARELVGIEGVAYAGNHGLELLLPEADASVFDHALEGHEGDAAAHASTVDLRALADLGIRLEDKGPIQALHWRGAPDEGAAEQRAREIAEGAEHAGLDTHWGRKVLELRPPGGAGKDRAVAALLGFAPVKAAIYAGDDRTDFDAFHALRRAAESGALAAAVCVGVASDEAPPELAAECDLLVDGPPGWLAVLRALAG